MYKFINILVILSYSYFLVKHGKKCSFMFILSTFKYFDRENDCLKQLKHHFKPFLIKMKVICAWCESVLGCCSLSISVYTRGSPVLFPIFTVNEGASHRLGSKKPKKKKKPQKTFSVANFSEYSPPVEADLSLENVVEKNKFLKLGTRQWTCSLESTHKYKTVCLRFRLLFCRC